MGHNKERRYKAANWFPRCSITPFLAVERQGIAQQHVGIEKITALGFFWGSWIEDKTKIDSSISTLTNETQNIAIVWHVVYMNSSNDLHLWVSQPVNAHASWTWDSQHTIPSVSIVLVHQLQDP